MSDVTQIADPGAAQSAAPAPSSVPEAASVPPPTPVNGASGTGDQETGIPALQRRLNEEIGRKYSEIARAEQAELRALAAEQALASLQDVLRQSTLPADGQDSVGQQPRTYSEAELQARAQELAQHQAHQMRFNESVNAVVMDGRGRHADFDQAVESLRTLTGGRSLPQHVVETVLATGEVASEVLYHLGKNPIDADRVLSLRSAPQQAMEIARLAEGLRKAAAPQVSQAPDPVRGVVQGGGTAPNGDLTDPNMSMGEWIKRREAQRKARRAAR